MATPTKTPPITPSEQKAEFSLGAKVSNPSSRIRAMLIIGPRMIGKTRVIGQLPNSLTIDITGHAQNYETKGLVWDLDTQLRIKNKEVKEMADKEGKQFVPWSKYAILVAFSQFLKNSPQKPNFLNLDALTDLEEICLPKATQLFKATKEGATYTGSNVLADLGYGKGQVFLKDAMKPILDNLMAASKVCTIFTGHILTKPKMKQKEGDVDREETDVDLSSQVRKLVTGKVEATAAMYRSANGAQNILSFENNGDSLVIGGRPAHLQNKKFVISEMFDETGNLNPEGPIFETHWNLVFPDIIIKS